MLIVDDEESVCDFLSAFFEARFEIRTVGSAEAALKVLLEEPPFDILLVDKNLPGMSGVELIRQVREADDDVSIAMITGYASTESIVETLNLGVDAYVEKPFNSLQEFGALVDSILARKKIRAAPSTAPAEKRGTVVGAIGDFDRRIAIAEALAEDAGKVLCVGTEGELVDLLKPEPDVVLLDTEAWHDWTPKIVETIAERAPFAGCVILNGGNLDTDALKHLVELGVVSVLMWHADPDWKAKLVASVKRVLSPAT